MSDGDRFGPAEAGQGAPEPGWVEPQLAEEFPGLALFSTTVPGSASRSPREVREQLDLLSDRYSGAQAVHLRQQPIPWAYRVFFRNVGLDPDATPTPVEDVVLDRMQQGRFRSDNVVLDAVRIAIVETGVAVRAFDADRLEGRLGLRQSRVDEPFSGREAPLPDGTLVIADERRAVSYLFGQGAEDAAPSRKSRRICIAAVRVGGVPDVSVEEAPGELLPSSRDEPLDLIGFPRPEGFMTETALLERAVPSVPPAVSTLDRDALMRRDLRRQIAGMERELCDLFASAFPRVGIAWALGRPMHGPRLLRAGELEALRDDMASHLSRLRAELGRRADMEGGRRRLLEAMVADPAAHKWRLVSNEQIGEAGCRHWHSRPRLGPIGMIMGWWRVKISSGCPLVRGRGLRVEPRLVQAAW